MNRIKKPSFSCFEAALYVGMSLIALGVAIFNNLQDSKPIGYVFIALGGLLFGLGLKNKQQWSQEKINFNTMVGSKNIAIKLMLHFFFWFSYLLVYTTLVKLNLPNESFGAMASRTMIYFLPIDMMATYFTLYFLMPRLLYKGKYIIFILNFILSAIFFVLLTRAVIVYILPYLYPQKLASRINFWEFSYFYYIVATYSIVILAGAIKLSKRWFEIKERQTELEKQSLTSELTMLKMQVSPHFLFNTLNNIDSLIYSDQEKASEAIIKLSRIMRYMLYEAQQGKVKLAREVEYLKSLIELQSLRLSKENFIAFDIDGEYDNKIIGALLFVPFIENAIKHGDKTVDPPGIIIKLNINDDHLSFEIVNFVKKNQQKDTEGGIGLNNVKRRLDILYPEKHQLEIIENDKIFKVELKITF